MKRRQEVTLSRAFTCSCLKHMASEQLKNESKWCEQNVWLGFKDSSDSIDGTEYKHIIQKEQTMCSKTNANTDTNRSRMIAVFVFSWHLVVTRAVHQDWDPIRCNENKMHVIFFFFFIRTLQEPRLSDLHPIHGPIAGGTRLTISGTSLDAGSSVKVKVNSTQDCEIDR